MAEEESVSEKLRLNIKTTRRKEEVEVAPDCTVKELKELLAKKMGDTPVSQQCLIFAGRILKDEETLEGQGVKDGVTIHLVVRSTNKPPQSSGATGRGSPSTTTNGTTPSPQPVRISCMLKNRHHNCKGQFVKCSFC